ncbi:MAG: lanthionine synthetase LanC family protein, partial [Bacteroidota bacterium]
ICGRAVWHNGQCNWLAKTVGDQGSMVAKAMPSDVYSGVAGTAWFLAELYAETREPAFRAAALGGMRQALSSEAACRANGSYTFYQGRTGMLVAAIQVSERCDEPALIQQARAAAGQLSPTILENEGNDLLSGLAGVLIGVVALGLQFPEMEHLKVLAKALADAIVLRAEVQETGASWSDPVDGQAHNLCGLSHGASGIALALIEAARWLDTPVYDAAIEEAFAYEASWYHRAGGRWPDLRYLMDGMDPARVTESVFWCHGSPGISLALHRAEQRAFPNSTGLVAQDCFAHTLCALEQTLDVAGDDMSICHGVCGNAASLLPSGLLSEALTYQVVSQVAAYLKRVEHDQDTITGVDYFTGLAGIGSFLLHVPKGAVPALMLPVGDLGASAERKQHQARLVTADNEA